MAANHHTAELHEAIEAGVSYAELCFALRQRMTEAEYLKQAVLFGAMRYWPYVRLPGFVRANVTEEKYYVAMVRHLKAKLQLYPYPHVQLVVRHTHETPLSYYTTMVAELLKEERSYDTLPNFTAVDVLNCIGIGRNQYLDLIRDVRSKVRWQVNRSFVKDHLPTQLLSSMELPPFCRVVPVTVQNEQIKKMGLTKEELSLYSHLVHRHNGRDSISGGAEPGKKSPGDPKAGSSGSAFEGKKGGSDCGRVGGQSGVLSFLSPSSPTTPLGLPSSVYFSAFEGSPVAFTACRCGEADGSSHSYRYACELPKWAVCCLYHKGLVCTVLDVNITDQITVPPLERFVMNRTSDDPIEVLLYKVLGTIDNNTSLSQLAQLLALNEEDLCLAVQMFIRLNLAQTRITRVPEDLNPLDKKIHSSWSDMLQNFMTDGAGFADATATVATCTTPSSDVKGSKGPNDNLAGFSLGSSTGPHGLVVGGSTDAVCLRENTTDTCGPSSTCGAGAAEPHPAKRLVLLYDTRLMGFLMMTNLSSDTSFQQHVVTLFEMGKLSGEAVGSFIEKLGEVQDMKANAVLVGEAAEYVRNVLSLRDVLRKLRRVVGPGGECGVDMLKVESINEQDSTTRYSLLARNYWAYFVASPVSQAPLLDVGMKGVYGSAVNLMPSPWMMLYLYERVQKGPPSVLLPVGWPLYAWPPPLQDNKKRNVVKLRMQPFVVNSEVTYVEAATSLILANEMLTTAPLFVQRVVDVPLEIPAASAMAAAAAAAEAAYEDGGSESDVACSVGGLVESPFHVSFTVMVPFTASDEEATTLLHDAVRNHRPSVTALRFVGSAACDTTAPTSLTSDTIGESVPLAYIKCFREAVAALKLQDSLGHFTFHVSLYEVGSVMAASGEVHLFRVDAAYIVDMGLGMTLADQSCCDLMLKHLDGLLTESRMEAHSCAMQQLSRGLGSFLELHSSLTATEWQEMALKSAAIAGPLNQQHVRRLGENGNGGAPFPNVVLLFDGERLHALDGWDPLVELWQL